MKTRKQPKNFENFWWRVKFNFENERNRTMIEDVKHAREVMRKALEQNAGLKLGYVSNVAMLLHDRYGITDYEQRNQAAEDILKLIFD